jgi:hypothetical protein
MSLHPMFEQIINAAAHRNRLQAEYEWRLQLREAHESITDLCDDILSVIDSLAEGMDIADMRAKVQVVKEDLCGYVDDEIRGG